MGADNLLLVAGRIGTLDIYAVAAMVWAVALYVRRRPLAAAVVLGIGAACKEVAVVRAARRAAVRVLHGAPARRPSRAGAGADRGASGGAGGRHGRGVRRSAGADGRDRAAVRPRHGALVPGGALGHLGHIISYAADLTSPHGPQGIASYPWEWLVDYKPIVYLSIAPGASGAGVRPRPPRVAVPRA